MQDINDLNPRGVRSTLDRSDSADNWDDFTDWDQDEDFDIERLNQAVIDFRRQNQLRVPTLYSLGNEPSHSLYHRIPMSHEHDMD
jgi:hypothetical protein